eukprot:6173272-Pleurochrysis_carterae.AAC.1
MFAVVFDNPAVPWEAVPMADFIPQVRRIAELDPLAAGKTAGWGAVGAVILRRLSARGAKCPSAMLRDKYVVHKPGAAAWEVFFRYTPGAVGYNFAPLDTLPPFPFHSGSFVTCTPPFLSSSAGTNLAPASIRPLQGLVLGILIGTEYNASLGQNQHRRWVLASIRDPETAIDVDCFVPFEKVSKPSAAPPAESTWEWSERSSQISCERAVLARPPNSVH